MYGCALLFMLESHSCVAVGAESQYMRTIYVYLSDPS